MVISEVSPELAEQIARAIRVGRMPIVGAAEYFGVTVLAAYKIGSKYLTPRSRTRQRDRILAEEIQKDKSIDRVCEEYEVKEGMVKAACRKYGVSYQRRGIDISPRTWHVLRFLLQDRLSVTRTAKVLGLSVEWVRQVKEKALWAGVTFSPTAEQDVVPPKG